MHHQRALAVSIVLTLLIAFTVLLARDQLVATDAADEAPVASAVTATELPLVNLVQTGDGQTVAVPANSLAQTGYDDDDHEEEEDDDEHEDHDEDEDDDDDD